MSSIKSSLMRSSAFLGQAPLSNESTETRRRDRTKTRKPGYAECPQCGRVAKVRDSGRLWGHRSRHNIPCRGPGGDMDLTDQLPPAPEYDRKGLRDRTVRSSKVPCPTCDAQPDEPCVTATGGRVVHRSRRRMALRAGF